MADFRVKSGTSIVIASTNYAPTLTYNNLGTRSIAITCNGLANDACRECVKFDMLTPRGSLWKMTAAAETTSIPTAGKTIDYYMGFSNSATAGQDNPGKLTGTDANFVGYGSTAAHGVEALRQLRFIGSLVFANNTAAQVAEIGVFVQELRYGILVVHNKSGVAWNDDVETAVRLTPIVDTDDA